MKITAIASLAFLGAGVAQLQAQTPNVLTPEQTQFFESHIRPALVQYCYDCHSVETGKTRGGLLLDTRDAMLRGGDNGNALAGTTFEDSLFWNAISWQDLEMPPKDKMPANVIQHFQTWLEMGAPDPRVEAKAVVESSVDIEAGRSHWAFQPLAATAGATIDSLVAAKLKESTLEPVPAADAGTLLRRLNFDLIGLPPTPEEVAQFKAAWKRDSQAAVAAKVDELLDRPQYGERWGRHWLDVARYGESTGRDVNTTFPHIWRYRDYVYDSFNADKPYDEFIREQIAGDLLEKTSDTDWQENLIATGFLAMGTKSLNQSNPRQHRMDVADEQIDTMSQAILGLTISCARCHDHKSDPIPTTDYYALAGIFLSSDTLYGTLRAAQNKRPSDLLHLPVPDPMNARNRYSEADIQRLEQDLQDMLRQRRSSRGTMSLQAGLALSRRIESLTDQLKQIGEDGIPVTLAMAVLDSEQPSDTAVLVRGDVEKPAQTVERGFPQVLPGGGPAEIPAGQSGRRELADWLTSKNNPLTARVMVNRIWLKLIGEGLVTSPNDWGVQGRKPSHPELLDHLAIQFMKDGWSIKKMVRAIVLTETYQRSSQYDAANYERDPDNKLLWRAHPRRLDAEAIRDSILAIGGGIDLNRPHASPVAETGDKRVGQTISQDRLTTGARYRSVYLPILRDELPDVLDLFDFADPNVSMPKRESTNVPAQALYLMNNPLVLTESVAMARKLIEQSPDRQTQFRNAFLLAYGRPPDEADTQAVRQFLDNYRPVAQTTSSRPGPGGPFQRGPGRGKGGPRFGPGGASGAPVIPTLTDEEQTLAVFCQSLMASAEFRLLN